MTTQPRREPLEYASADDLHAYAAAFGLDPALIQTVRKCPVCEAAILALDNGWLDAKSVSPTDNVPGPLQMGVMRMGAMNMMCSRDPGQSGSAHTMHIHQPDPAEDLE